MQVLSSICHLVYGKRRIVQKDSFEKHLLKVIVLFHWYFNCASYEFLGLLKPVKTGGHMVTMEIS